MLDDDKYGFLDNVVLMLNLVFVRFDAFLNNYIELTFLAVFLMLFAKFTYAQCMFTSPVQALLALNALIVASHYVYSIVYIVNDYLDFESVQRLKAERGKYSFYRFRPIIHYSRSITIVLCSTALHIASVLLLSISLTHIVWLYSLFLASLAFVHSRSKAFRPVTFTCLHVLKYILFFILLYYYSQCMFTHYTLLAFTALILPFLPYHMITYAKTKTQLWQMSFHRGIKLLIVVLFAIFIVVLVLLSELNIILPFIKSLLITSTPFLVIRQLLRFLLGAQNPDIYTHITRLTIFFFASLTLLTIILFAML